MKQETKDESRVDVCVVGCEPKHKAWIFIAMVIM